MISLFLALSLAGGPAAGQSVHLPDTLQSRTHLLWHHPDGRAAVWALGADGALEIGQAYGPVLGWTPLEIGAGLDRGRLLWRYSDGRAAVWFLNPRGGLASGRTYAPAGGWVILSIE